MKRLGLLILIVAAGCSPHYTNGKTQCSSDKQCPSGYSCSDDGTSATHYCFDNKSLGCPSNAGFYCSQSKTCWAKPGACATVTYCGTTKNPGNVICNSLGYHPDCNSATCVANGVTPDSGTGGVLGTGGSTTVVTGTGGSGGTTVVGGTSGTVTAKGGSGGTIVVGSGGVTGTGGLSDGGLGGNKDVGAPDLPPDLIVGTGGVRDAAPDGTGGIIGTGGVRTDGGLGGVIGTGGTISTGGTSGASLCSGGPPLDCSTSTNIGECKSANGCVWNEATYTCQGTPSSCSTYTSGTWCIYNGCTWSGSLTCNATTMTTTCAGYITSSSTSCTVCDVTMCCGQLTNCMNDTNCWDYSTGPLFQAWMDCLVGCCYSSC
jgi:hypothetical protein